MSRGLLTLSMIVKNEARSIGATLASVKPFIDRWIIVDTESTDNTREIVRRDLASVAGELHEAPFVDFETTRNLALDHCGQTTEFVLWLDADDILVNGAALRGFLERERSQKGTDHEAYLMRIETTISFYSARIMRSRAGWRFKGVVHEVLTHPDRPPPTRTVPGASIKHHPDGDALARSQKRWARDAVLLSEAVKREPTHARSAFYLAMTYLWLGRHDEAIPAFRRRIDLGGWREEVYQAKMGLAQATEQSGSTWPEVLALYLDAHAFAPHRAEPLYRVALHYNTQAEHALCLVFARRGMDLPLPEQDILFVDADVYRWKLFDLVGSSAYWVGEFALGEEAARKALRQRPDDARLKQNLAFYLDRRQKENSGRSGRGAK